MYRFSIFATMVLVLNAPAAFSQAVGIGTSNPHSSAQLEISATQKGILIPRVALTGLSDKTTITTPAASLLVYNSNNTLPGGAGFYYWTGTVWAKLITPSDLVNYSGNWGTSGNGGTNAANFIGTTDNQPLRFRANNSLIGLLDHSHINFGFGNGVLGNITTGSSNIALGSGAGSSLTTGAFNIAIGENVMMHETDSNNTVMGVSAMINNSGHRNTLFGVRTFTGVSTSSGNNNTALGYEAMRNAKGGSNNVAVGLHALYKADGRSNLVAIGDSAMYSLTTGNKNMAVGSKALKTNILGTYNLALGNEALYSATGSRNIAIGNDAMRSVQIGFSSTALGNSALFAQSNPVGQIAIGDSAMYSVTAGSYNTVIGTRALGKIASPGPSRNTIIGAYASADITTASNNNTIIGSYAMRNTAGNDNVVIGDSAQTGVATASIQNNVLIGKSVAAGNKQMSHTVAIGYKAMANITDGGDRNIAIGSFAMGSAPFGERNIGIGDSALFRNPLMDNVAIGAGALLNMTGDRNIALGYHALYKAEAGTANIAIGRNAAAKGVDPGSVVAIGDSALYSVDALDFDGARSTAIGHKALKNTSTGFLNTAIGYSSGQGNITGNRLTLIGHGADVTTDGLNNATAIGANATVSANNTMAFGNSNVERWVFGLGTTSAGAPSKALEVAATGRPGNGAYLTAGGVWTNTSDVTLKENFSEVNSEDILQKIMQLPISRWRYKGTDEFHIGPMAQDFYALFQVGIDEKHISTIDPNGIALLAIQQLKQENTELQKLLTGLQERIALLEKK